MFDGETVGSIVIRLDKAFPAKAVAEQLQMADIRPVLVSNELGDILGQAFPERGVLFAFEQNHEPGKPSMKVTEIVLEPVGADPFILRAETNLDSHYESNLHDLDEAIKLAPNIARAHWLRARVLAAMNRPSEALAASAKAVELQGDNPRFRITTRRSSTRPDVTTRAVAQATAAVENSENRPHVKARAQLPLGRSGQRRTATRLCRGAGAPHGRGQDGRPVGRRPTSGDPSGGEGGADRRPSRRGHRYRLGSLGRKGQGRPALDQPCRRVRRGTDRQRRRDQRTSVPRRHANPRSPTSASEANSIRPIGPRKSLGWEPK